MTNESFIRSKSTLLVFGFILSIALAAIPVLPTHAATRSWDGGGADDLFSTAENWVGNVAPQAGDDLVFDNDLVDFGVEFPDNDLAADTSFNSLTFEGAGTDGAEVTGNGIELVAGLINSSTTASLSLNIGITLTANQTFAVSEYTSIYGNALDLGVYDLTVSGAGGMSISTNITGSGDITSLGAGYLSVSADNATYSGNFVINEGILYVAGIETALGDTTGTTTVNDGASIALGLCVDEFTIAEDINLNGAASGTASKLFLGGSCQGGGGGGVDVYGNGYSDQTATLSGSITLGSDITFTPYALRSVMTGPISGAYSINVVDGYIGKLVINSSANTSSTPNGTYVSDPEVATLSDNQPSQLIAVFGGSEVYVTGTRGDATVNGGRLGGTGTVGAVSVSNSGVLAPGLSPGCLSSGNLTFSAPSTFEVEINGTTACSEYDRMEVTGTVDVTDATLDLLRLSTFAPASGDEFVIINNDGGDAVTGTFDGMPAGSTFTIDDVTYRIDYDGGTGNDVVLTVIDSTVGEPDTGAPMASTTLVAAVSATLLATMLMMGSAYIAKRR